MQATLTAVGPNRPGIKSTISIQKAAIKGGCLVATFGESYDNGLQGREFEGVKCNDRAHPDLLAAFRALVPHFCQLTDQISDVLLDDATAEYQQQLFAPFTVTGVSYDSKGLDFTLVGTRDLDSGKKLNLIAPFITYDEAPEGLSDLLEQLNAEAELGLRGKCADAGRQLDMFDTEQQGAALVLSGAGAGTASRLLGAGAEDVDYEEVGAEPSDDDGPRLIGTGNPPTEDQPQEPGQPKKRGRGRPKKQQPE